MNDVHIVSAIIITTLFILVLLAIVTVSVTIASKQRIQQKIMLAETRLNYEKELRKVETEVSEQMMYQMASELHDNVSHTLTCMRIMIENKKLDFPEMIDAFQPVETYLDDASREIRLLSRSLNSDYISSIGLANALKLEIERLQQLKRYTIHWEQCLESPNLDKNQELMAFRIFQEIVQNTLRHSKATDLHIFLSTDKGFCLTVSDNGIGFDLEQMLHSHRVSGLKNIMKRAGMAGMNCNITTSVGQGCTCRLQIA